MTPYRKALIEHMTLHGLSDKTLDSYVYWMRDLCAFINQTPDRIRAEDVGRFLVHLIADRGLAYSSVNQAKCGILYFFRHVMGTPSVVGDLPPMKQGSALPSAPPSFISASPRYRIIQWSALTTSWKNGLRKNRGKTASHRTRTGKKGPTGKSNL